MQDSIGALASTYRHDGNSNLVSVETNGHVQAMAYNAIDQRTDVGFAYDANGRLIHDNGGRSYVFDDQSRLLSVAIGSGANIRFAYRANKTLGAYDSLEQGLKPYYRGTKISTIEILGTRGKVGGGAEQCSLFSGGENLISSYTTSSSPTYSVEQLGSASTVPTCGVVGL